jgi:hypothetical protein
MQHCRRVSKKVSYLLFSFFWLKIVGIHSTINQNLLNLLSSLFRSPFWAAANCLIVAFNTKYTDGVFIVHSKGPCFVAAIIGTPNRTHRPWSIVDIGIFFSVLKMIVDSMRAFILFIAV